MLRKRNLIIGVLVAALAAGAGSVGAQIIPVSKIIERLQADTKGGWVKIDKSPQSPGHQRVYCITLDGYPSCDWNDVRTIDPGYRISKR